MLSALVAFSAVSVFASCSPEFEPTDEEKRMYEMVTVRRPLASDGIALARKAGDAVSGYEKVRGWLDTGRGRVLVQATDGSGRQKTKLNTPPGGRFIGCLTGAELGLAFGREHAIHAALAAGGLCDRIVEDAAKLSGLRRDGGGDPAAHGSPWIVTAQDYAVGRS